MKYIIIFFSFFLISCSESSVVSIETKSKNVDTISTVNKCKLKIDTFSFKDIKIGMNLSDLKNIKKINEENLFIDEKIIQLCNVSYYSITNVSKYTIFEKKIDRITLSFFNQKLFEIDIELKDNIVLDLAKKFEVENCVEDLYTENKTPKLTASNEKFILFSHSNSLTRLNSTPLSYEIIIIDKKVEEIVMYCLNKKKEKKSEDRLKDF